MFEKIKQLKDLRDQANQLKALMATVIVSADAWDGKIKVTMDGNQEITGIEIDASLFATEHKEKLQNELRQAINEAGKKARLAMAKQFQQGGISLPSFGG